MKSYCDDGRGDNEKLCAVKCQTQRNKKMINTLINRVPFFLENGVVVFFLLLLLSVMAGSRNISSSLEPSSSSRNDKCILQNVSSFSGIQLRSLFTFFSASVCRRRRSDADMSLAENRKHTVKTLWGQHPTLCCVWSGPSLFATTSTIFL